MNAGPNANISFYIADPADPYWADTFGTIASQMKSAGVDGLYIDQLAGYFPQPCFGRAGGDAAGTGWADGGRRLLSKVTEVLGPVRRSILLTSELLLTSGSVPTLRFGSVPTLCLKRSCTTRGRTLPYFPNPMPSAPSSLGVSLFLAFLTRLVFAR